MARYPQARSSIKTLWNYSIPNQGQNFTKQIVIKYITMQAYHYSNQVYFSHKAPEKSKIAPGTLGQNRFMHKQRRGTLLKFRVLQCGKTATPGRHTF